MNNSRQLESVTSSLQTGADFRVGGPVSSGEERAKTAPLGIYAKLRTPPLQNAPLLDRETGEFVQLGKLSSAEATKEARRLRFKLQDEARNILYLYHGDSTPINAAGYPVYHRTCSCSRLRVSSTVQIVKSSTNQKSFFSGLSSCANARTCPICAAKINERKANELRMMANQAKAMDKNLSLLTFTTPHTSADKIEDLVPKISAALSSFWRGAWATRFRKKYGIIGNIRSFEILHGANGWHPHFHIILVSEHKLPCTNRGSRGQVLDDQSEEWLHILRRWQSVAVNAGLGLPNFNGLDLQNGDKSGEYISKFGSDDQILETKSGKKITWDMMDEATKGMTKVGKKGSRTPWQLLADSADNELSDDDRKDAKLLFLFYARAMKGVNLIRWSRGLRDYFGLGKQASDEEIIQQEEDKADLLCHILSEEWKLILKRKQRNLVLDLAENGGAEAVARYLFSLDQYADDFSVFYAGFAARGAEHDEFEEDDLQDIHPVAERVKSNTQLSLNLNEDCFKSVVEDVYRMSNRRLNADLFRHNFVNGLKIPYTSLDEFMHSDRRERG